MTKANIGKARWARARAASLWQRADTLDMDRSGDWAGEGAAEQGAASLGVQAARCDSMAGRLEAVLEISLLDGEKI